MRERVLALTAAFAVFTCLLLSAGVSVAQGSETSLPAPITAPILTGIAISKGGNCPAAQSPSPGTAPTIVSVTVAVDGSVKTATIAQSSGIDELDEVAVSCITTNWRFLPALRDGQPIEAIKKFVFKWQFVPQHAGPEQPCVAETSFMPTYWKTFTGQVFSELSFTIATDGSVKNVAITKSSGSSRLDYDATNCVTAWRFQPVVKDGQPIEYPSRTRIPWRPARRP